MKRMQNLPLWAAAAAVAILLASAPAVRADIVTYNDGRVVKGIMEDLPGNPNAIALTNEMGRITIPKTRIKSVQQETKALGLIHIGEAYLQKSDFAHAADYFQQALTLEPANADAARLRAQAADKLAEQQHKDRSSAIDQIDKLGVQARALIQKGEFAKAEKLLIEANKLIPSTEQKKKLAIMISEMYLAWAEERSDKLDQAGAEEKLNLSLAANPTNDVVIEKMLKLWENDPQKRQYTVRVYETILERHPEDRTLERNLANIYFDMGRAEEAVRHYLNLFKSSEEYKGTQLEQRLVESLDKLHRQYAMKRQYDKAIHYFDLLATLAPKRANPTEVLYYTFYQKGQGIKLTDFKGRLDLATFAEQSGLDKEALDQYRALVKKSTPQIQAAATAGITRYAGKALADAQLMFDKGSYSLARAMADSVRREYADVTAVQEKVAELIGKAQAEESKERRKAHDVAVAVLARADEFYATAYYHYQNLSSTQRKNLPALMSDRTLAKQNFEHAIDAYNEALRIDPSLGRDSRSIVQVRLNDAKEFLGRLNLRPAPLGENFVHSTAE